MKLNLLALMNFDALTVLNTLVMIGILVSALYAAFSKKLLSSIIALGVTGGFVSLGFILLQAPDVAIAEAAVGAVLSTVLFIIALQKTSKHDEKKEDEPHED